MSGIFGIDLLYNHKKKKYFNSIINIDKDNNKKNYQLDNIEMLCYNHYFLTVGDIFTNKQIEGIEDNKPVNQGKVEWEVDDYHLQRLKELGLDDEEDDDPNQYISRI